MTVLTAEMHVCEIVRLFSKCWEENNITTDKNPTTNVFFGKPLIYNIIL